MKETEPTLLDQIIDEVDDMTIGSIAMDKRQLSFLKTVAERYAEAKAKAIASKVAAMQKEIEDNHDGDPWNNGAITTLEEVKKLFL